MKVLLACSAGMSSAIAAKSLSDAAKDAGIDMTVQEVSSQAFEDEIKKGYALGLVAPQIRHRFDVLKGQADAVGVPCLLINPKGYSPIGGKFLLQQIQKEAGEIFE
ncbi:PTS sugar transporter subunit IIB [Fundicoccus culcitae]|uniref:PTS sugar transporter subunit IIB n=1 Tax=Fundicoccus culcitae TaxID=2969821 RepID=A0ABY5P8V3_9LACT|nr:PTS sugar transporter subunit IIB [Fundicoccus culcitae]UUX35177.1 PTS sugar transporter subunit IIB [Fundicoccus culcitae]